MIKRKQESRASLKQCQSFQTQAACGTIRLSFRHEYKVKRTDRGTFHQDLKDWISLSKKFDCIELSLYNNNAKTRTLFLSSKRELNSFRKIPLENKTLNDSCGMQKKIRACILERIEWISLFENGQSRLVFDKFS
jgi:hypothetical protein